MRHEESSQARKSSSRCRRFLVPQNEKNKIEPLLNMYVNGRFEAISHITKFASNLAMMNCFYLPSTNT